MKVKCVDLFELEQIRERRNRFLRLVTMALFAMVAVCFADGAVDATGMTDKMKVVMGSVIPIVKYACTAILLIMFMTKIIPALTGGQKDTNWWELIGILTAVIAINTAEVIFKSITSQSVL